MESRIRKTSTQSRSNADSTQPVTIEAVAAGLFFAFSLRPSLAISNGFPKPFAVGGFYRLDVPGTPGQMALLAAHESRGFSRIFWLTVAIWLTLGLGGLARADALDPLLDAIRRVEGAPSSSYRHDVSGMARGAFQIHESFWTDCRTGCPWTDAHDDAKARAAIRRYWARYCPQAVAAGDFETMARVFNGGPAGARKSATINYWRKVREAMK